MVNLNSFSGMLNFIQIHGYFLIFLIMIIGGSAATIVAAFSASLGYLNIFLVILLSFFAELAEGALFYSLGYFGRRRLIGKYGSFLGIRIRSLYKLETHFQNHLGKTLFFMKMTPFLSIPGLTLAGVSHVPIKKYASWSLVFAFSRSIFFSAFGFFLGVVANKFLREKSFVNYLFILILIIFILSWIAKYFGQKIIKKELSLNSIGFFKFNLFSKKFVSFKTFTNRLNFVNKFIK